MALLNGAAPYNRPMLWPEPVERTATFLRAAGAESRLEELAVPVRSAKDAAEAIGCAPEQVVESHVYVCDGRPVLALVPGNRRVDATKVEHATGASLARPATLIEVKAVTGFAPGAISPFALSAEALVLVERTILSSSVVWVSAGSERHLVMLAPVELVRLTRGLAVDLVPESA